MNRLLLILPLLSTLLVGCGANTSASTMQGTTASPQSDRAVYDAQMEEFTKQQEETARQIARAELQMNKQDELLVASAALLERQQAVMMKQEQQVKRYDAILEKWERQAAR